MLRVTLFMTQTFSRWLCYGSLALLILVSSLDEIRLFVSVGNIWLGKVRFSDIGEGTLY